MINEVVERILIQRNKAVDDMILGEIRKIATENGNDTIITLNDKAIIQALKNFAEVKHGEWMPDYETFVDEWERESEPIQTGWVCSLCGRQEFNREPYCHCGAKMDGGKAE